MAIKKSVHIRNLPPVHPGLEQRIRDAEEAEIQGRSPKKLEQIQKITRPSLHVSAAERASQARAIGLVDPAYRAFSDGLAVLAKQIPFRPGEDLDQIWDKLSESDKVRAGATERFRLEIDAAIRLATREWKIPHQIAGRLDARNLKRSLENIEAEIAALAYLLAPDSQELLKTVIDDTRSLIDTSLKHQAIKGVDGATMHTILRDLAHKMVYQELVSRRRGMGDRGIRRIAANIELAETLYKKLKRLPDFSLRERLWMRIVHIHQDLGHTAYAARASFRGGRMHRAYGVRIFTDEINRYRKIFPHQELRRAREAVATHAADVFPFADDRNLALIRAVDHLAPFAPHRVFKHLENIEGASDYLKDLTERAKKGDLKSYGAAKEAFTTFLFKNEELSPPLRDDILAAFRPFELGAEFVEMGAIQGEVADLSFKPNAPGIVSVTLAPDAFASRYQSLFDVQQDQLWRLARQHEINLKKAGPGSTLVFSREGTGTLEIVLP